MFSRQVVDMCAPAGMHVAEHERIPAHVLHDLNPREIGPDEYVAVFSRCLETNYAQIIYDTILTAPDPAGHYSLLVE
jgi:hypothetical protein